MRKFTESIQEVDLFSNEDTLNDILLEYKDQGFKYSIKYKLFKKYNDGNNTYLMPILSTDNRKDTTSGLFQKDNNEKNPIDFFDKAHEKYPKDVVRGYEISFIELFESTISSNIQRGDNRRGFAIPKDNLYNFFDVTKEIQKRFESMGYVFLLSVHANAEFDIHLVENYEKIKTTY